MICITMLKKNFSIVIMHSAYSENKKKTGKIYEIMQYNINKD